MYMSFKATGEISCEKFTESIYMQRFRGLKDREMIKMRYFDCFGIKNYIEATLPFSISEKNVIVGGTRIERNIELCQPLGAPLQGDEPVILRSLLRPLEALALCVQMNWPCLLVGPPASGKSGILKTLCEATNMHFEEVALTSSSDINELIGCFEQTDVTEAMQKIVQTLGIVNNYTRLTLVNNDAQIECLQEISSLYFNIAEAAKSHQFAVGTSNIHSEESFLVSVEKLLTQVDKSLSISPRFSDACSCHVHSIKNELSII